MRGPISIVRLDDRLFDVTIFPRTIVSRTRNRRSSSSTSRQRSPMISPICEHDLEGVVAKRRSGRYLPGGRGWVKVKNKSYWRYELERESVIRRRGQRQSPLR